MTSQSRKPDLATLRGAREPSVIRGQEQRSGREGQRRLADPHGGSLPANVLLLPGPSIRQSLLPGTPGLVIPLALAKSARAKHHRNVMRERSAPGLSRCPGSPAANGRSSGARLLEETNSHRGRPDHRWTRQLPGTVQLSPAQMTNLQTREINQGPTNDCLAHSLFL